MDGTLLATFLDETGTVADLIQELVTENLEGYDMGVPADTTNNNGNILDCWKLLRVLPRIRESSKFTLASRV